MAAFRWVEQVGVSVEVKVGPALGDLEDFRNSIENVIGVLPQAKQFLIVATFTFRIGAE